MAGEIPVSGQAVLLITASRTTFEQIRRALGDSIGEIVQSASVLGAVALLERLRPGLALLDLGAPGLTPFRLSMLREGLNGRLVLLSAGPAPGRFDLYPSFSGEAHPSWEGVPGWLRPLGTLLQETGTATGGEEAGRVPMLQPLRLGGLVIDPLGCRVTLGGAPWS